MIDLIRKQREAIIRLAAKHGAWNTVVLDIPELKRQIQRILEGSDRE